MITPLLNIAELPMANLDFVRPTLIHKLRWAQLYAAFEMAWHQNKLGCNVVVIDHPKFGLLTGVKSGHCWMVIAGEYIDAVSDHRLPELVPSQFVIE
jgi:hypothetical protein